MQSSLLIRAKWHCIIKIGFVKMLWNELYCEKCYTNIIGLAALSILNIGFNFFVLSCCRVASRQSSTGHSSGWGCYHKDRGWLEKTQHALSLPGKILYVDYSLPDTFPGKLTPVMSCSLCRFECFRVVEIIPAIPFLMRKMIREAFIWLALAVLYSNHLPSHFSVWNLP